MTRHAPEWLEFISSPLLSFEEAFECTEDFQRAVTSEPILLTGQAQKEALCLFSRSDCSFERARELCVQLAKGLEEHGSYYATFALWPLVEKVASYEEVELEQFITLAEDTIGLESMSDRIINRDDCSFDLALHLLKRAKTKEEKAAIAKAAINREECTPALAGKLTRKYLSHATFLPISWDAEPVEKVIEVLRHHIKSEPYHYHAVIRRQDCPLATAKTFLRQKDPHVVEAVVSAIVSREDVSFDDALNLVTEYGGKGVNELLWWKACSSEQKVALVNQYGKKCDPAEIREVVIQGECDLETAFDWAKSNKSLYRSIIRRSDWNALPLSEAVECIASSGYPSILVHSVIKNWKACSLETALILAEECEHVGTPAEAIFKRWGNTLPREKAIELVKRSRNPYLARQLIGRDDWVPPDFDAEKV